VAVEYNTNETCPEVDSVTYMPGVYKTAMVRMIEISDELANVRV
jgi:hypothetical protein